MEGVLYMVASITIINLSFIRNYSTKVGVTCPCVCPFHTRFARLKNMFIDRTLFMSQMKCGGEFVHSDKNAFVQHCENQGDFPHLLLIHYLNEMYPKPKPGKKRKKSTKVKIGKKVTILNEGKGTC